MTPYIKFGYSQGHSNIQIRVAKNAYIVLTKCNYINNRLEFSPIFICRPYPQLPIYFFNPEVKYSVSICDYPLFISVLAVSIIINSLYEQPTFSHSYNRNPFGYKKDQYSTTNTNVTDINTTTPASTKTTINTDILTY